MIEIDGSQGEGGGQILRSSLSLSICTQQPFRITRIRANRDKPGLKRQHLTAVRAAAEISAAEVEGADLGSRELTFRPGPVRAGNYSFAIGTAGSCTLVLQTVLPPLLTAGGESSVRVTGGTHNRGSPPFDFLQRAFVPLLARMGAPVDLTLASHGFYPRGGGEVRAHVTPASWSPFTLDARGQLRRCFAEAYVAGLSAQIGQRELATIAKHLAWPEDQLHLRALPSDMGPGNALTLTVEHENVTEVFTGFGEKQLRAEEVALAPANEAMAYLSATAPVGEHLADQLLLPLALGKGGSYRATSASAHLRSNALVIERFTSKRVRIQPSGEGVFVSVS
jgi:RNA 3'-terminal phosphate cyclase (ATP)